MEKVTVIPYLSPTLVLLAMDWADGLAAPDFLGFAIKRTPGFRPQQGQPAVASSWLPNRLGFNGPNPNGADMPSNTNPVQHFEWWDANIYTEDRGTQFTYEVYPTKGPFNNLTLVEAAKAELTITIPQTEEQGIGTYFNRAVVSSQAFARDFPVISDHATYVKAMTWLANGMQDGLLGFIDRAKGKGLAIAAYHLTDAQWILPALSAFDAQGSIVYFFKGNGVDDVNVKPIAALGANHHLQFAERTKTSIMHNKFMVRVSGADFTVPEAVTMGTANYTSDGMTQQANVIHTFESPDLAALYLARQKLLTGDPTVGTTAAGAAWSEPVQVGDASIRVFFAPEAPAGSKTKTGSRLSIDEVVDAVKNAKSSVFFSLFSATDKDLLDACLSVSESGKLMRGLVNSISKDSPAAPGDGTDNAATAAATWMFERSQDDNMVVGHDSFGSNNTPSGFWQESNILKDPDAPKPAPGDPKHFIPPVFVHQKIIIIDGASNAPTIFCGSANLSGNSTWHNDENLLEITGSPRLAKTYVAEFMRLYEQYRSRFSWNNHQANPKQSTFSLTKDTSWAAKDYKAGTMEFLARKVFTGQDI